MGTEYDVIWWWKGGREVGTWNVAMVEPYIPGALTNPEPLQPGETRIDASLRRLRRMGYVAHPGCRSIGPPDGPPSDAEFRALGL